MIDIHTLVEDLLSNYLHWIQFGQCINLITIEKCYGFLAFYDRDDEQWLRSDDQWLRLIMFHRVMNYLFFISVWWNNNTIECSQSPIFPWDRRDQRLCVKDRHLRWVSNLLRRRGTVSLTPAPSVHLKIKMSPFNGKTRYISTISQENRGMWTV